MPKVDPVPVRRQPPPAAQVPAADPAPSVLPPQPQPQPPVASVKVAVPMECVDRLEMNVRRQLVSRLDLQAGVVRGVFNVVDGVPLEVPCLAFRTDDADTLLSAARMCDVVRDIDRKAGCSPMSVWVRKDKAWTRVPWNVNLTVRVRKPGATAEDFEAAKAEGDASRCFTSRLNPEVFGAAAKIGQPVEPLTPVPKAEVGVQVVVRRW